MSLAEADRKRRTAYQSGRRENAGIVSIKKDLHPDGRETKRKVSKKLKRKALLGPTNNDRTEFKPKFWKRA